MVVVFRTVQAEGYGEALRRVADRLCAEFADPGVAELPGTASTLPAVGGSSGLLAAEDEALVGRLREVLIAIAATLAKHADEPPVTAIKVVLDGAEFVVRGELFAGNADAVLQLVPSFVFLLATVIDDQDRAIELSRRTTELIEEIAPPRS